MAIYITYGLIIDIQLTIYKLYNYLQYQLELDRSMINTYLVLTIW